MRFLITIIALTLSTTNAQARPSLSSLRNADSCKINLSWGHGGAPNVKKEIRKQKLEGRTIYQGCGVEADGDIQYQAFQLGTNGDWQLHTSTDFYWNGGFNPVMSKEALKSSLQFQSTDDDYELTYKYEDAEDDWYRKKAKELRVKSSLIKRTILQVGFTRLTHYNWAALIKEADDLFNTQACTKDKIKIKFNCHSNYEGANHGRLGKRVYERRIFGAQLLKFSEKTGQDTLLDASNQDIKYDVQTCVNFPDGSSLKSIPMACGETHEITRETIKKYKQGPCGSFLKKVSKKYSKEEEVLDTKSIFDIDHDSVDSTPTYQPMNSAPTYTPSGPLQSYPIHPNAMDQ